MRQLHKGGPWLPCLLETFGNSLGDWVVAYDRLRIWRICSLWLEQGCHPGCRWFGRNARGTAMWLAAISFKKSWATGMAKASFVCLWQLWSFQGVFSSKRYQNIYIYIKASPKRHPKMLSILCPDHKNRNQIGPVFFETWVSKESKMYSILASDLKNMGKVDNMFQGTQVKTAQFSHHHKLIDVRNSASKFERNVVTLLLYLKKHTDFFCWHYNCWTM